MEKKYHTDWTVPKYNRKIADATAISIPLACKYMTAHFLGLVQAPQ